MLVFLGFCGYFACVDLLMVLGILKAPPRHGAVIFMNFYGSKHSAWGRAVALSTLMMLAACDGCDEPSG
ncbi:MAG: hypothetical protein KC492_19245, partial [Myxococcales bacterium]|nr:hypothetical protein [Myxococcales bacterium]